MTANQIAYAKLQEEGRHNLETESQGRDTVRNQATTAAANYWQAQTASLRQEEDARHNRRTEGEIQRHNRLTEELESSKLQETERANRAKEAKEWFTARSDADYKFLQGQAVIRQAAASERQANAAEIRNQLTHEQNLLTERGLEFQDRNSLASLISANTGVKQAELRQRELEQRADEANEVARHNRATEGLTSSQISSSYSLGMSNLGEVTRSHLANEMLTSSYNSGVLAEQNRHNIRSENISVRSNQIRQFEANTGRINAATNQRNAQTRAEEAYQKRRQTSFNIISGLASTITGFIR